MTTEHTAGTTATTQTTLPPHSFSEHHSDGTHSDWTDDNIITMTSASRQKKAKKRWNKLANVRRAHAAFRSRGTKTRSQKEFMGLPSGGLARDSLRLSITSSDGIMKWLGEGQLYTGSGSSEDMSDRESSDWDSSDQHRHSITRSRTVGQGRRGGTLRKSRQSRNTLRRSISRSPQRGGKPSKSPRSRSRVTSRDSFRKTPSIGKNLPQNVYKPIRRKSAPEALKLAAVIFKLVLEERGSHLVEMTSNTAIDAALERLEQKYHVSTDDLRVTANGESVDTSGDKTLGALTPPVVIFEGSARVPRESLESARVPGGEAEVPVKPYSGKPAFRTQVTPPTLTLPSGAASNPLPPRRQSLIVPLKSGHHSDPQTSGKKKQRDIFFRNAGLCTGFYEVVGRCGSIVRTGVSLSSTVVFKLPPGTRLHVEEIEGNRMRINEPYAGWVSFQSGRGKPLLKYKFQSQHKSPRARSASPSRVATGPAPPIRPKKKARRANSAAPRARAIGLSRHARASIGRRKRVTTAIKFNDQHAALSALQSRSASPPKAPSVRRGAIFKVAEQKQLTATAVSAAEVGESLKMRSWGELEAIIKRMVKQRPELLEHVLSTKVGINI